MSAEKRIRVLMSALRLAEGPSHHLGGNYFHAQHLAAAIQKTNMVELSLLADEYTFGPLRKVLRDSQLIYTPLNDGGVIAADRAVSCAVRKHRPDIYHRTNGQLPFALLPCYTVATIADINFNYLPTPPLKRLYKELSFRWTAWQADRITCVSEFARNEVLRYLHADANRLTVIHHGTNKLPPADSKLCDSIPKPYWLTFGHQAHKNVEVCLAAIARKEAASHRGDSCLVVVGQSQHISEQLKPMAARFGIADKVHFVGRVDDAALHGLYLGALGLLFISRYEGFGLPVLEAMTCGCPVICSNVCSLPEVAGDAAILVDPDDIPGISEAMRMLQHDPAIRNSLMTAGKKRAASFTWSKAAKQTVAVYQSLFTSTV